MLHGNAGQASDRVYATDCFSPEDSVFVLEYPGYGARKGVPSKKAFDLAAKEAYLLLRQTYPNVPVCVAGESIGTGPASSLAELERPPDKVVLLVAFDQLSRVAADHFPSFLVDLLLTEDWNNSKALSNYIGQVEIYGALEDSIISVNHAMALAAAVPTSKLVIIEGGHNDWSEQEQVKIRNP